MEELNTIHNNHYVWYQGLVEPKRQECMQLNVNRQTAKCKVILKYTGVQESTDMGGSTQNNRKRY